jgi:hypothetical protein
MAVTASQTKGIERIQMATGSYLDDAAIPADASIGTGFKARYVQVVDETNNTMLEWYEGMAAASAIQTVATGDRSTISSGGITVTDRGISFPVTQNAQYRWKAVS